MPILDDKEGNPDPFDRYEQRQATTPPAVPATTVQPEAVAAPAVEESRDPFERYNQRQGVKPGDVQPVPYERGLFGDIASHVARGVPEALGMAGRGLQVLDRDAYDDKGVTDRAGKWLVEKGEELGKTEFLRPDISEVSGEESWFKKKSMEGLESLAPSVTPLAVGLGVGAVATPVAGVAAGVATMGGMFFGGTYKARMDDLAEKRPDMPIEERSKLAAYDGGIEFGGELVSDAIAAFTGGLLGKAGTQGIKKGVKGLLKTSPKEFLSRFAKGAPAELATETGQAKWQSEIDKTAGTGEAMGYLEAAKEVAIPTLIMFGVMHSGATGVNAVRNRHALDAINSEDPDQRVKAFNYIDTKIDDPELRTAWHEYAGKKIQGGEAINVEMPLDTGDLAEPIVIHEDGRVTGGVQAPDERKPEDANLGKLREENLPAAELLTVKKNPDLMEEYGVTPEGVDSLINERSAELKDAERTLAADPNQGPLTRAAGTGVKAEQAQLDQDLGEVPTDSTTRSFIQGGADQAALDRTAEKAFGREEEIPPGPKEKALLRPLDDGVSLKVPEEKAAALEITPEEQAGIEIRPTLPEQPVEIVDRETGEITPQETEQLEQVGQDLARAKASPETIEDTKRSLDHIKESSVEQLQDFEKSFDQRLADKPQFEPFREVFKQAIVSRRDELTKPQEKLLEKEITADKAAQEAEEVGKEAAPSVETVVDTGSVAHGQEVNAAPSEAQKESGNYQKAHVNLDGMDITIENPAGSTRSGKDKTGREWEQKLANDYGYIKQTEAIDGDHVDVFFEKGYKGGAEKVHVVNQYNQDGTFDEPKVVIGAKSKDAARSTYKANYEKGWTGGKDVVEMTMDGFKKWVKSDAPKKGPAAEEKAFTVEPHGKAGGFIVKGDPAAILAKLKESGHGFTGRVNEKLGGRTFSRRKADTLQELFGEQAKVAKVETKSPQVSKPIPKPTETVAKEEVQRLVTKDFKIFKGDIPYQLAYDAHRGSSHDPGERAKQVQDGYVSYMEGVVENLSKLAKTDEQKANLRSWFNTFYKPGYLKREKARLQADSRTMSSMITGPARFPTRINQKKLDTAQKRMTELLEWDKKVIAKMKRKLRGTEAISSTDPEATTKLQKKLASLEDSQAKMKAINKVVRNKKLPDIDKIKGMVDIGLTEPQAKELLEPDFSGKLGFPSYALTNNNANIKRIKGRIADLEKRAVKAEETGGLETKEFEGGSVELNYEDGFLRIYHDEKPSAEVRQQLKSGGFRWSPRDAAWRRKLTEQAKWKAEQVTGVKFAKVPPTTGTTTRQAQKEARQFLGGKGFMNWKRSGVLKIVQGVERVPDNVAELPSKDGKRIAGYYNPSDKSITLIADNLKKDDVRYTLLHEGAHRLLDTDAQFKKDKTELLDQFEFLQEYTGDSKTRQEQAKAVKAAFDRARAAEPTGSAGLIREEGLTYFLQDKANHKMPIVRRIVAKIRAALRRLGIPVKKLTNDDFVELFLQGVRAEARRATVKEPLKVREKAEAVKRAYAGELSKTADKGQLALAIQMHQDKANPEAIRQHTGWHLGKDNKWRYEIDDSKATFSAVGKLSKKSKQGKDWREGKLSDLMSHKDLFEAYPEMKDLKVIAYPLAKDGERGVFSPASEELGKPASIAVFGVKGNFLTGEQERTLLHEVQHSIQFKEGFAFGGSPGEFKGKVAFSKKVLEGLQASAQLQYLQKQYGSWEKAINDYKTATGAEPKAHQVSYAERVSPARIKKEIAEVKKTTDPYAMYQRLFGEIEARDTADRMLMDAEGRRAIEPYTNQGIPMEDAIVKFADPGVKYSVASVDKVDGQLAEDLGSITEITSEKQDIFPGESIISTPEYTLHKDPAGWRMFEAASRRRENKTRIENEILDGITENDTPEQFNKKHQSFVRWFNDLEKTAPALYKKANDYLLKVDRTGKAFRVKRIEAVEVKTPDGTVIGRVDKMADAYEMVQAHHRENYGKGQKPYMNAYGKEPIDVWAVIDPKGKPISEHATQGVAAAAMIESEAVAMADKGYRPKAVEAVVKFRNMANRAFDRMIADYQKIADDAKSKGLDEPTVSVVDESKRYGVFAPGATTATEAYESKEVAEEHIRELAKVDRKYAKYKVKKQKDGQIKAEVKLTTAIAMMGDLRGSYFPRQRQRGGVVMMATNKEGRKIREHFDLYLTKRRKFNPLTGQEMPPGKLKSLLRESFNRYTPLGRRMRELKRQGFDVTVDKSKAMPESIFEAAQLMTSINAMMEAGLEDIDAKGADVQAAYHELNKMLSHSIADIFKARGGMSSRMKRARDYWEGFETDMTIAGVQYAKGLAATIAKRQAAQEMTEALTGRDVSWAKFKEENEGAKWEEYQKFVNNRMLDPKEQPALFKESMSWMKEVLRNEEQADRIIGTLKGLAVLKFLGFRVSSAAVNMTNLYQAVPATISSHSGGTIKGAMLEVTRSLKALSVYSKGNGSDLDKQIFTEIKEKGWDDPQFNHENAAQLRSNVGNKYAKFVDASMWMFGRAEKINRASTIHAAYKQFKKNNPDMEHADLMEKAKHSSDRAHGIYGKETAPVWTRGTANILRAGYTFKKFSHNYMLNMAEMIGSGNKKEAAYMLLSPAILAGGGATLVTPVVAGIISALGGGDDPEEELYKWAADTFGTDRFLRHGLAGLAGVNLKGSLQMNMPFPTSAEELIGAPGAVVTDIKAGIEHVARGEGWKAAEKILPAGFGNVSKAVREYREGVTTGSYGPVYYGDEPLKGTAMDAFLRGISFNPARLSGIREMQWSERKIAQKYQKKASKIRSRIKRMLIRGDGIDRKEWGNIMADIYRYNEIVRGLGRRDIRPMNPKKTLRRMIRQVRRAPKRERERRI